MGGVVEEQHLGARSAGARRDAADDRQARVLLIQEPEERAGRERERVDEHRHQRGVVVELRDARDREAVVGRNRLEVKRAHARAGERAGPESEAGSTLELAPAPDDALGHAAEQVGRPEPLANDGRGHVDLRQMSG